MLIKKAYGPNYWWLIQWCLLGKEDVAWNIYKLEGQRGLA